MLWTVRGRRRLSVLTFALIWTTALRIGSRCTLGLGLLSLRITVCILGALHLGIFQEETLVAFRASVRTIDLTLVACCRCAVKTFACLFCLFFCS